MITDPTRELFVDTFNKYGVLYDRTQEQNADWHGIGDGRYDYRIPDGGPPIMRNRRAIYYRAVPADDRPEERYQSQFVNGQPRPELLKFQENGVRFRIDI